MGEGIIIIIQLGIPILLLLIGWIAGKTNERMHYRSIEAREAEFADFMVTDLKSFPGRVVGAEKAELVTGQCVVATDYLKSFLSGIRKIFGGEMKSYLSLLDRARREAILRAMEEAHANGYNAICNLRLETSNIGASMKRNQKGGAMVEVYAYGTAYRVEQGE